MSFLDRVKSLMAAGPIAPDPALGDADARRIAGDLQKGDIVSLAQALAALREGPWDDRQFLCDLAVQAVERPILARWCASAKDNGDAWLARGRKLTYEAFATLGTWNPRAAAGDALGGFKARLNAAGQDLMRAIQLAPGDPTPFVYMITISRGLEEDVVVARRRFREVVSRDPQHFGAHLAMLEAYRVAGKGSFEDVFGFARESVAAAPPGSELALLTVAAHMDRWLEYRQRGDENAARAYVKDAVVVRACVDAYTRSLGAPEHRPRRSTIRSRNLAAFWFFLAEDRTRLKRELDKIGAAVTDLPWRHAGPGAFENARKMAGP